MQIKTTLFYQYYYKAAKYNPLIVKGIVYNHIILKLYISL